MKSRAEILSLMSRFKPTAQKKYGMTKLGIFGSVARGEDTEESDIDVLIVSPIADEIRQEIIDLAIDIVLDKEEVISPMLMSEDHFNRTKDYPFLTNVLEEGVVIG